MSPPWQPTTQPALLGLRITIISVATRTRLSRNKHDNTDRYNVAIQTLIISYYINVHMCSVFLVRHQLLGKQNLVMSILYTYGNISTT